MQDKFASITTSQFRTSDRQAGYADPSNLLRQHILNEGIRLHRARNDFIFTQGYPVGMVYLLNKGIVALAHAGEGGQKEIYGFVMGPTFIIPPIGLDHVARHSAECLSDVDLYAISRQTLDRIVEKEPLVGRAIQYELGRAIDLAHRHLSNLLSRQGMERVVFILTMLQETLSIAAAADGTGEQLDDWIPIAQVDLSAAIGITPVYLNQILKKMKLNGLIELKSGKIRILRTKDFKSLCDA